jgi:hypothetical protein
MELVLCCGKAAAVDNQSVAVVRCLEAVAEHNGDLLSGVRCLGFRCGVGPADLGHGPAAGSNGWDLRLVGFVDHSGDAHAGELRAVGSYNRALLEYCRGLAVVQYVILVDRSGGRNVGIQFLCCPFGGSDMRAALQGESYPGEHGFRDTAHGDGVGL